MAESQLKWKRGDYIRLGQAVAQFNRKINELQKEEKKLYLPEILSYSELKEETLTRRQLNNTINSLRRFNKEGAEEIYRTEAGEEITKWERQELSIEKGRITRSLNQELKELNIPSESGFSKAQMGDSRVKSIKSTLESFNKLEKTTGYEFKKIRERIHRQGSGGYTMKKAIVYKENYLNVLSRYSHLDNYDKLMEKLNTLINPVAFYEFMKDVDELTEDLTYQSDQNYTQQAFNSFVENLGIEIDKDSVTNTEKLEDGTINNGKVYRYSLITKKGDIVARSDSRRTLINIAMSSKDEDIANSFIIEN